VINCHSLIKSKIKSSISSNLNLIIEKWNDYLPRLNILDGITTDIFNIYLLIIMNLYINIIMNFIIINLILYYDRFI